MTKAGAVHGFWSSFGLAAYEESSVPDDAVMPYITYEFVSSDSGEECAMSAGLWYYGTSRTAVNGKADEIASAIGSGLVLGCDGGFIRIRRGVPFAVSAGDPNDRKVRRMVLNIAVMYLTH